MFRIAFIELRAEMTVIRHVLAVKFADVYDAKEAASILNGRGDGREYFVVKP